MLRGGPTVTGSTTLGDSTFSEDEWKYRYAANAATRMIAVFTLGKYRCRCSAHYLLSAVFGPCIGPRSAAKFLFNRSLPTQYLGSRPGEHLRPRKSSSRLVSSIAPVRQNRNNGKWFRARGNTGDRGAELPRFLAWMGRAVYAGFPQR